LQIVQIKRRAVEAWITNAEKTLFTLARLASGGGRKVDEDCRTGRHTDGVVLDQIRAGRWGDQRVEGQVMKYLVGDDAEKLVLVEKWFSRSDEQLKHLSPGGGRLRVCISRRLIDARQI